MNGPKRYSGLFAPLPFQPGGSPSGLTLTTEVFTTSREMDVDWTKETHHCTPYSGDQYPLVGVYKPKWRELCLGTKQNSVTVRLLLWQLS